MIGQQNIQINTDQPRGDASEVLPGNQGEQDRFTGESMPALPVQLYEGNEHEQPERESNPLQLDAVWWGDEQTDAEDVAGHEPESWWTQGGVGSGKGGSGGTGTGNAREKQWEPTFVAE